MDIDSLTNTQVRLAARPVGLPTDADWSITTEPVAAPGADQVLVRQRYISLDPAMRGWMNDVRSYVPPVGIGEVMRAGGVGEIVASDVEDLPVGTSVTGTFGVQEYVVAGRHEVVVVDPAIAPLPTYLGTLGMPGMTAYFGLTDVGRVAAGETVVVSGAAGAVGAAAGQIAKILGARVVGIAGGKQKCAWLVDELGFDAAIDYKDADVRRELRTFCPDGVDVYFDNVGGEILDAVLARLAHGARVAICGAISQYNVTGPVRGPSNYLNLLVSRASMTGFVVFDYAPRFREAAALMAGWIADGRLQSRTQVVPGIRSFPSALLMLFAGENTGKLVLEV